MSRRIALSLATFSLSCMMAWPATAADETRIATGSAGGLYFAAGEAICRAFAASPTTASMPCRAVPTAGSISNILELNPKTVQFAIVQADAQYNAVAGLGLFAATGPDKDLRSVFSIHPEALSVVVRAETPVSKFDDLRGARFSAGRIGTGTRETVEALFEVLSWTTKDKANLIDMPVSEQNAALCEGKIDAAAFLTGHPAPMITELANLCAVKLVAVSPETIKRLTFYYQPAVIAAGIYTGHEQPIETVGFRTALVTTAEVPDRVVRAVAEAVFAHLDAVRNAAPAFATLGHSIVSFVAILGMLFSISRTRWKISRTFRTRFCSIEKFRIGRAP